MHNTRDFEQNLTTWEAFPETHKTWTTFKTYFNEDHLDLKRLEALQFIKRGIIIQIRYQCKYAATSKLETHKC